MFAYDFGIEEAKVCRQFSFKAQRWDFLRPKFHSTGFLLDAFVFLLKSYVTYLHRFSEHTYIISFCFPKFIEVDFGSLIK